MRLCSQPCITPVCALQCGACSSSSYTTVCCAGRAVRWWTRVRDVPGESCGVPVCLPGSAVCTDRPKAGLGNSPQIGSASNHRGSSTVGATHAPSRQRLSQRCRHPHTSLCLHDLRMMLSPPAAPLLLCRRPLPHSHRAHRAWRPGGWCAGAGDIHHQEDAAQQ